MMVSEQIESERVKKGSPIIGKPAPGRVLTFNGAAMWRRAVDKPDHGSGAQLALQRTKERVKAPTAFTQEMRGLLQNERYERMRNDHKRIGLSADRALAWHELGHGLPATHLEILTSVELLSGNANLGGRAGFDPDRLSLPEDYSIAVMGPAAQLLYTDRFAVPPPSFDFRPFVEHYVMRPALSGDLTLLRSRWPGVNIADADFRRSILMLADAMNADGEVFTWLIEASEALVAKGTITASELPAPPQGLTMLLDGLR